MSKDVNEIIMGAGEVYMYEFDGKEIPTDAEIETEEHNVAKCHGGFKIDYKPTKYDIKDQYASVVKSVITKEDINAKTGLLTWNLNNLALLSTAKFIEDDKTRTLTFGGGGSLKTILLRFVHTKENQKKIRFTMIGQGGNGFGLEFGAEKELTVDADIQGIKYFKDFLAEIEEEKEDSKIIVGGVK